MFLAPWHKEDVSGAKRDAAVAQLYFKFTLQNKEEIVRVGVPVSGVLAQEFDDHDVIVV